MVAGILPEGVLKLPARTRERLLRDLERVLGRLLIMSTTRRERREHIRLRGQKVRCLFPHGLSGVEGVVVRQTITGYVVDVSMGGARIEVPSKFASQVLEQKASFDLELNRGERQFLLQATIAWRLVDDEKGICSFGVFFSEEVGQELLQFLHL